jgi:predicted RNA-binding protein with PUA-like domain
VPAKQYFLLKSEPDVFSIENLERDKRTGWEGVRNYQARNLLRGMHVGDLCLFYHSNAKPPGVAGLCRVAREAYPDETQFDPASRYYDAASTPENPRWSRIDVAFVERFAVFLSLETLKATAQLNGLLVCKPGTRLSVQPVSGEHFAIILGLAHSKFRI